MVGEPIISEQDGTKCFRNTEAFAGVNVRSPRPFLTVAALCRTRWPYFKSQHNAEPTPLLDAPCTSSPSLLPVEPVLVQNFIEGRIKVNVPIVRNNDEQGGT